MLLPPSPTLPVMARLGLAAFAVLQLVACQGPMAPFPGSPAGCSCSSLPLDGGSYSAGALALCTGCTDVYRSTDQNSCPEGWKIFSPASKGDWDTALASVRAIQAEHDLLVDVTRGASVCEDCPPGRFSQSSFAAEAAGTGWVTSDFTDWWLQDADAPSQPSGDYTANCYLGVSEIADTSNIIFNGGACNHHSTEYLCQPAVPPCGCQVLVNQAQPDDVKFCSKDRSSQGQADQCYPRQADGTRDGTCPGDMTKCNGLFRAPISECGDFELRNGAKESQEFLCYQKHPDSQDAQQNGNYLVPTQGCSTEYCTRCTLSKCQNALDQTDTDCATKEVWKCCMRKSECASECASSQEECFDCLHDDARRTVKCCEEVGIPGSQCQASERLPLCDLSSCEAGDEDCMKTQRMRCCVEDAWDCKACETPGCVESCRESRRAECCADVGIDGDAECAAVSLVDVPCFQPGDVVLIASLGLCDTVEEETCVDDEISLGPGGIGFIMFEDLQLVDDIEECPCFHRGDWVLIHSLDVCGTVEAEVICAEQSGSVNAYQPDSYDPYMLIEDPVSFDDLWPCPADVPVPCFKAGEWVSIRSFDVCFQLQGDLCAGGEEVWPGGDLPDVGFWGVEPCTCFQTGDVVFIDSLSLCNTVEEEICAGESGLVGWGYYSYFDLELIEDPGVCPCFQPKDRVGIKDTTICGTLQAELCFGQEEWVDADDGSTVQYWYSELGPCENEPPCLEELAWVRVRDDGSCGTLQEELCAVDEIARPVAVDVGVVATYFYRDLEPCQDPIPCFQALERVSIGGQCGILQGELCADDAVPESVDLIGGPTVQVGFWDLEPCTCFYPGEWVLIASDPDHCGNVGEGEICAGQAAGVVNAYDSSVPGSYDLISTTFEFSQLATCPDSVPVPCFQAGEWVSIRSTDICFQLQAELCAGGAEVSPGELFPDVGFWDVEPCICFQTGDVVWIDSLSLCNTVQDEEICAGGSGLVGWGYYPYEDLEPVEDTGVCPCFDAKDRVGIQDTTICGTLQAELCFGQQGLVDADDGSTVQYWYSDLGPCENEPPCLEAFAWVRVRDDGSCGTLQEELCAVDEIAQPVAVDVGVVATYFYRDLEPCPDPIPCFQALERVSSSGQCGILQGELCADDVVLESVDLIGGPTVQVGFWDLEPCTCFYPGEWVLIASDPDHCGNVGEGEICAGQGAGVVNAYDSSVPGSYDLISTNFEFSQLATCPDSVPVPCFQATERVSVRETGTCGVLQADLCAGGAEQSVVLDDGSAVSVGFWGLEPCTCLQPGDMVSIASLGFCDTLQNEICPGGVGFFGTSSPFIAAFEDLEPFQGDCPPCFFWRAWVRVDGSFCGVLQGPLCPDDPQQQEVVVFAGGFVHVMRSQLEVCQEPVPCFQVGDRVSIQDSTSCGTVQTDEVCADDELDQVAVLVGAGGDLPEGLQEFEFWSLSSPCGDQ